ncbi:metallophosphoesterase [Erysipelotrichaceae bacterium 51-3]
MTFWILFVSGLILALILLFFWNQKLNKSIQITRRSIELDFLPPAFDGYRILQVSDLHGNDPYDLIDKSKAFKPDLIACTGDIFDGVRNTETTFRVLKELAQIAPVYFVSGNHEYYAGNWPERTARLRKMGIHLLENECTQIWKDSQSIELCGVDDPDLNYRWLYARRLQQHHQNIAKLPSRKDKVRILLSHRADLFEQSLEADAHLILSGHIHGGHWRILNKGILTPYNGDRFVFFPKYDAGLFRIGNCQMFVSRGLGDQMRIPRLLNPPELVWITLRRKPENNTSSKPDWKSNHRLDCRPD